MVLVSGFGDSHSRYFGMSKQLHSAYPFLERIRARTLTTSGSSILGLGRRNSTLGTLDAITQSLQAWQPTHAIFAFGQVDIELGYYYRIVVKGEDVPYEAFLDRIIETYSGFLQSEPLQGLTCAVKGVNLSVLTGFRQKAVRYTARIITENVADVAERARLQAVLEDVLPDDAIRAARHRAFNERLASLTTELPDAVYFDVNAHIVAPDGYTVRPDLIPAGADHHIIDSLAVRAMHWVAADVAFAQSAKPLGLFGAQ